MKQLILKNGFKIVLDINNVPLISEGMIEVNDIEGNTWVVPLTNIEYYCYWKNVINQEKKE